MKRLFQIIGTHEPTRVLWYGSGSEAVTEGMVNTAHASFNLMGWYGRRVAIGNMRPVELAYTLALLDGVAESLLLMPIEQDTLIQHELLKSSRTEVIVGYCPSSPVSVVSFHDLLSSSAVRSTEEFSAVRKTSWILPTSGTTGVPKLIAHTLESLTRGISNRKLNDRYTWASLYNPRRFAGLQVFLQALISGSPLILSDHSQVAPEYFGQLVKLGCNALSATPTMWRKLAMYPGFEELPLKQITLGGEIADQPILDLLQSTFPKARITHIYASTEAGVCFAVRDGKAGFPISYLDSGTTKVSMRIDEANHLWLFREGYASNKITDSPLASPEWLDSGDLIKVDGDRVYFVGRASGAINVGGNKVMPEEVEEVIREVQGIAFAVVKGRKNPMTGNLVEAHIATLHGWAFDEKLKRKIIAHCRERLEPFKVPFVLKSLDNIEFDSAGKISRKDSA